MKLSTTMGLAGFAIADNRLAHAPSNGEQTTQKNPRAEPAGDLLLHTAPLTYHQERLWFIDEFERDRVYTGPPSYHNIPVLLRIRGEINPAALEAARGVAHQDSAGRAARLCCCAIAACHH
jgi:hypothetical protein